MHPDHDPDRALTLGSDLLQRWTEPHRRYHGTRHLVEMFWAAGDFEEAELLTPRQAAVLNIASWYHDAIYEIGAADNEDRSAALAEQTLPALGLEPVDIAAIAGLVRATASHDLPAGPDPLPAAMHDADLAVFAAPEERFDEYCAQVREEYAAVPEATYRAGRSEILRNFSERQRLYATSLAHSEWEPAARANLARELQRLAG